MDSVYSLEILSFVGSTLKSKCYSLYLSLDECETAFFADRRSDEALGYEVVGKNFGLCFDCFEATLGNVRIEERILLKTVL